MDTNKEIIFLKIFSLIWEIDKPHLAFQNFGYFKFGHVQNFEMWNVVCLSFRQLRKFLEKIVIYRCPYKAFEWHMKHTCGAIHVYMVII